MKRRDFLKILGACVVAPGTAIAAVKAKPESDKERLWRKLRAAHKNTKFKSPHPKVFLITYPGWKMKEYKDNKKRWKKYYTGEYYDKTPHQSPEM